MISAIQIIHDKEMPPEGFSLIQQTADTNQKAFQKKQLCYKLGHHRSNVESIVEVAILSKLKSSGSTYGSDLASGFDIVG